MQFLLQKPEDMQGSNKESKPCVYSKWQMSCKICRFPEVKENLIAWFLMISSLLVIVIKKKMKFEKEREKKRILQYLPQFNLINILRDKKAERYLCFWTFSRGFASFQARSDHWLDLVHSQRQTWIFSCPTFINCAQGLDDLGQRIQFFPIWIHQGWKLIFGHQCSYSVFFFFSHISQLENEALKKEIEDKSVRLADLK